MPDGVADPASAAGSPHGGHARRRRGSFARVRINLALWSGGITLAVLVVLGAILYLAVERSLAASGTAQLVAQANPITGGRREPGGDPPPGGLSFGGPNSGTFTMVVDDDGRPVGRGAGAGRSAGHGIGRGGQGDRRSATSGPRRSRSTVVNVVPSDVGPAAFDARRGRGDAS